MRQMALTWTMSQHLAAEAEGGVGAGQVGVFTDRAIKIPRGKCS